IRAQCPIPTNPVHSTTRPRPTYLPAPTPSLGPASSRSLRAITAASSARATPRSTWPRCSASPTVATGSTTSPAPGPPGRPPRGDPRPRPAGGPGRAWAPAGRARSGAPTPIVTWALLAVTIGIGFSSILSPDSQAFWFTLFGLDKQAVAAGESYRLVTVVFVHAGFIHLASNMYALYLVGPLVEGLYGHTPFLAFYLLTAIAASTASYVLVPQDAVGASGAIFGLFGVLFVVLRVHRPLLGRAARGLASQVGALIVLNLLLGFGLMGAGFGIDNAAHVGGLLAGAWLGLLIAPRMATLRNAFARSGAGPPGASSTALLAGVVRDARPATVLMAQGGEGQGDRPARASLLALVAQDQAPPDVEVAVEAEVLVERATGHVVGAPEGQAGALDSGHVAGPRLLEVAQIVRGDAPAAGHGHRRVRHGRDERRDHVPAGLDARVEQDDHGPRGAADAA